MILISTWMLWWFPDILVHICDLKSSHQTVEQQAWQRRAVSPSHYHRPYSIWNWLHAALVKICTAAVVSGFAMHTGEFPHGYFHLCDTLLITGILISSWCVLKYPVNATERSSHCTTHAISSYLPTQYPTRLRYCSSLQLVLHFPLARVAWGWQVKHSESEGPRHVLQDGWQAGEEHQHLLLWSCYNPP